MKTETKQDRVECLEAAIADLQQEVAALRKIVAILHEDHNQALWLLFDRQEDSDSQDESQAAAQAAADLLVNDHEQMALYRRERETAWELINAPDGMSTEMSALTATWVEKEKARWAAAHSMPSPAA